MAPSHRHTPDGDARVDPSAAATAHAHPAARVRDTSYMHRSYGLRARPRARVKGSACTRGRLSASRVLSRALSFSCSDRARGASPLWPLPSWPVRRPCLRRRRLQPTVQMVARQQRYPATWRRASWPPCAATNERSRSVAFHRAYGGGDPAVRPAGSFYQKSGPTETVGCGRRARSERGGAAAALLPATRSPQPLTGAGAAAAASAPVPAGNSSVAVSRSRRREEKVTRVPTRAQGHRARQARPFAHCVRRTSFSSAAGHPFRSWDTATPLPVVRW